MKSAELRETLKNLLEAEASRNQTDFVLSIVGNDAKALGILVDLIGLKKHPLSHRAAWALDILDRKEPELVDAHFSKLLDLLADTKNDSVKRSLLSITSRRKIPKDLQGFWLNYGFEMLDNPKEKLATKVFSMQIIANMAEEERDIIPELLAYIDIQYKEARPGFKARARRIRQQLLNLDC